MPSNKQFCGRCVFNHAVCPKCGIEAHTATELKKLFGLRTMEDEAKRVQSWCKKCRGIYK